MPRTGWVRSPELEKRTAALGVEVVAYTASVAISKKERVHFCVSLGGGKLTGTAMVVTPAGDRVVHVPPEMALDMWAYATSVGASAASRVLQ